MFKAGRPMRSPESHGIAGSGTVSFFAGEKVSTLVILNPLQRVKNPQAAYHRQKASGFFALRAQNDNRVFVSSCVQIQPAPNFTTTRGGRKNLQRGGPE